MIQGIRQRSVTSRHFLIIVVLLLAFALRVYRLGATELWYDEAGTYFVASQGFGGIISYIRQAIFEHPPFYFLMLFPWLRLAGSSEFALRFFSLLLGVIFVCLLYRFVNRFLGPKLAILSAFMATLSPFQVAYSREARMYTLLACLGLIAIELFLYCLEKKSVVWWSGFVLVSLIGMATHYYFALLFLVENLFLAVNHRKFKSVLPRWGLLQLGFLLVPLIWILLSPGFVDAMSRLLVKAPFIFAKNLKEAEKVVQDLVFGPLDVRAVPIWIRFATFVFIFLVLPGVLSRYTDFRSKEPWSKLGYTEIRFLLLLLLVVPFLAIFIMPHDVMARSLSFAVPLACYIFLALGLWALHRTNVILLMLGLLIVGTVFGYSLRHHFERKGLYLGQALAEVENNSQAGEAMVLTHNTQWALIYYYYDGNLPHYWVPNSLRPPSEQEVDVALRKVLENYRAIWLIHGPWTADPHSLVERWLNEHTYQAFKKWFPDSNFVAYYFAPDHSEPHGCSPQDFEKGISLLRCQLYTGEVEVGGAVRASFYWQSKVEQENGYMVTLELVDPEGRVWAKRVSEPCGGSCPTYTWQPGQSVRDNHALFIPSGTPPGEYRLQVELYWPSERRFLNPLGENDVPQYGGVDLGPIHVDKAGQELPFPAISQPLEVTFANKIQLLGLDFTPSEIRQGDTLALDLYWRALKKLDMEYLVSIVLVDDQGEIAVEKRTELTRRDYPLSAWDVDEVVRGQYELSVPADLPGGRYSLEVALWDPTTGDTLGGWGEREDRLLGGLILREGVLQGQAVKLASVKVLERDRLYVVPPIQHPLDARLGDAIRFLGYDVDRESVEPGGMVELTLYWQGLAHPERPYKVFTHLLDEESRIWGQHDSQPGQDMYPTNTWLRGEIVIDRHPIAIQSGAPPGEYWLEIGMYEEATGQRLSVFVGTKRVENDRILLRKIKISSGQ